MRKPTATTGKTSQAQISWAWVGRNVAPGLTGAARGPHAAHVALDGALADAQAQREQVTADALGAPQAILARHLPDQGHRLRVDLRTLAGGRRAGTPEEPIALTMPAQEDLGLGEQERRRPGTGQAGEEHQPCPFTRCERGPPDLAP